MPKLKPILIETIFGGFGETEFFGQKGQFLASIGLDPDMPKDDNSLKISGYLRPTAMEKFSGIEITGNPMWIITNPKTNNIYVYATDGKIHLVSSALAMGTSPGTLTTASGNGGAYYDNYIYFRKNTDVARYGPLNGTPTLTQDYWVTTLSKTALANTTYPSKGSFNPQWGNAPAH